MVQPQKRMPNESQVVMYIQMYIIYIPWNNLAPEVAFRRSKQVDTAIEEQIRRSFVTTDASLSESTVAITCLDGVQSSHTLHHACGQLGWWGAASNRKLRFLGEPAG